VGTFRDLFRVDLFAFDLMCFNCDAAFDGILGIEDDEAESARVSGVEVRFDGDVFHRPELAEVLRQILVLELPR